MKDAVVIVTGYLLVAMQGVMHQWIPFSAFVPDLVIPFILYLGIIDFGAARGAALAFVLGYFFDANSASPVGVHLFVIPATYLLYRFIHHKLLLSGTVFVIAMTFAATLTASLLIVGMRTLFERSIMSWNAVLVTIPLHSVATAVFSPVVFWIGTRLVPESPKRKEEKVIV